MGNIVTGFVRLIPKSGSFNYLPIGDMVTRLCTWYGGLTYHVPVFVRQNEFTLTTDIQFGAKWSIMTGVDAVWALHGSLLNALWWRAHDEGSDHDVIGSIDHTNPDQEPSETEDRLCRYQYDALQITWRTPPEDDLGLAWRREGAVWSLQTGGSYRADNSRCRLGLDTDYWRTMPTTTSLARSSGDKTLSWSNDELIPPPGLLPLCQQYAESIRFLWKGRAVRVHARVVDDIGERWDTFNLDDWDNCADPQWLAANHAGES